MLQTMRDNAQGIVAKVIVFFIIIVFALFGVESIVNLGSGDDAVAKVGDREVSELDVQRIVEQQKQNLRRQFGNQFDENLFNDQLLRQSAIEQLIQQNVDLVQADAFGLYAAPSVIDEAIVSIPAFQVDGKFNKEQFISVLRMNGWTPMTFRASLADDLKTSQAQQAVSLTNIATPFKARYTAMINGELRTLSWTQVASEDMLADVAVSEDEVQGYYDDNKQSFQTPETVKVRYAGFDRAALEAEQDVTEEDIESAYQDYVSEESQKEQRRSRHILIEVNDDRSDADAKALAESIKQQLDNGADFAELAKENSDDIASAQQGGELGFIGRGVFVPEFEDQLFSMNVGDVSAPVKTQFGYHIIDLEEVKGPDLASIDDKKAELESYIRSEKAKLYMAEQSQELGNLAFSSASIDELAETLGLTVNETPAFTRDAGEGFASSDQVRQLAFAENVLLDSELSDVVETDDGLYVFQVSEHKEPTALPLELVRAQVENAIKRSKALELAEAKADEIVAGNTEADWNELTTTFMQSNDLPRAGQVKAFGLKQGEVASALVPGGYVVVKVDAIQTPDMADIVADDQTLLREEQRLSRAGVIGYRKWAKEHTEIEQPDA